MNLAERKNRIIAKGEFSNHSHIITGEAEVRNENGEILIDVLGEASIEHLLESAWLGGRKEWTKEHELISLTNLPKQIRQGDVMLELIGEKTYRFIQQQVFDPLTKRIESAQD